ncbi:MAG: hypothetical protein F4138_04815 [Acidimicrobiia bacterium]|nr:hypothetical protein [Acidimicrobiia bacterium]MYC58543.1 hypothetical protein [Acidimicrobiia bacterium]MYG94301.1 hypothetical protein [Acidimicrobiia bacterium]MYI30350.1 hypothetical protein [Acidimicrobiia bacterium]
MSAANDLLKKYQHIIEKVYLITGTSGIFDVEVNGEMLYSKDATNRHAHPGEVVDLFAVKYAQGVPVYGS